MSLAMIGLVLYLNSVGMIITAAMVCQLVGLFVLAIIACLGAPLIDLYLIGRSSNAG